MVQRLLIFGSTLLLMNGITPCKCVAPEIPIPTPRRVMKISREGRGLKSEFFKGSFEANLEFPELRMGRFKSV